jgi:HlyD family secretion protein
MRKVIPLLAAAALTAAAAGTWHLLRPAAADGALVTAAVDRGLVSASILATGTVLPVVTTDISTQISGQVAEVLADFNDTVEQGQLLARLDPQTFAARVREAEAELAVARAELANREAAVLKAEAQITQQRARSDAAVSETESARARHEEALRGRDRAQSMAARGGISDSELEAARTGYASARALLDASKAQLRVAEAEIAAAEAEAVMARSLAEYARATIRQREAALEEARINLDRTLIRAPVDGIVIRRDVEAGQTVAASLQAPTLFTLAGDLTRMRVETYVDEADVGRVRVGQGARFGVDAYPGRSFEGRVTAIRKAPNRVQNVVTYTVLVDAANPDLALFPGMTAVVRIVVEEIPDALRIPNAALRYVPAEPDGAAAPPVGEGDDERVLVWRLAADGAGPEPVAVLTGASDDAYTAMLEGGLRAGDRLVIADRGAD